MIKRKDIVSRLGSAVGLLALTATPMSAAEPGCGQKLIDGTTPPATSAFITPRAPVSPFYQWENNDGYCGEVSVMQAGLSNGQWMSQFNARLVCGTGLSQSGVNGACAAHGQNVNYNAQLLLESPDTGVTGPNIYAAAAQCAANARLAGTSFDYQTEGTGQTGYQNYMSWIKQQVILGNQVTIGVLINGSNDPQYDHEVAVMKIGTNHAVNDPTYYPDDVLYIEDHGAYTKSGTKWGTNPSIPPGAGNDDKGCTPYIYGYSFASLGNTRQGANGPNAQAYSIILPADDVIKAYTGGSGYASFSITGPHNYGFSVSGPLDMTGETVPVQLTITGPTQTNGKVNPRDPVAGYAYENPMIGKSVDGNSCTNDPPSAWMTDVTLTATVRNLQVGTSYNLYEYVFSSISGTGGGAALAVPTANFNANAKMATHVTSFTAAATSFSTSVTVTSDKIVVFRAVPADAP